MPEQTGTDACSLKRAVHRRCGPQSILETLIFSEKQKTIFFLTWPVRKLELAGTWVVWLRLLRPLAAGWLFKGSEELKSLSPQLFFAPEPVTRPAQKAVFQKSASKSSGWPQLLSSSRLPGSRILLPEPMGADVRRVRQSPSPSPEPLPTLLPLRLPPRPRRPDNIHPVLKSGPPMTKAWVRRPSKLSIAGSVAKL